jgi:LacI family transcriptional regulator
MKPKRRVLLALTWPNAKAQQGVLDFARQRHWFLQIPGPDDAALCRHWRGDGIICTLDPRRKVPIVPVVLSKRVPKVELTLEMPRLRVARVLEDNDAVGRMAAEYFLDKGFRHFLFVARRRSVWHIEERRLSFQAALAARGATLDAWYYDEWPRPSRLLGTMGRRLRKLPGPLAVFCGHDGFADVVLQACLRADMRVPEDVAILGTGFDEVRCDMAEVPLSRVRAYTQRQGYEAAALLERILDGRAKTTTVIRVPPDGIVERASTNTLAIHDPAVRKAIGYIQANLHRPFSIAEMLPEVGMSHTTLVRKFRTVLNRGVADEINRRRIEEAKKLLLAPDAKGHLVGEAVGFSSPYYFYRVFRKLTGLTTGQYRRKHEHPAEAAAA